MNFVVISLHICVEMVYSLQHFRSHCSYPTGKLYKKVLREYEFAGVILNGGILNVTSTISINLSFHLE
jgi:hypothetical protein